MLAHEEKLKKAIDHIVEGLTPTELITNNGISHAGIYWQDGAQI